MVSVRYAPSCPTTGHAASSRSAVGAGAVAGGGGGEDDCAGGVSVEIVAAEPDITRNDWMQLLYNVFDPSQVIIPGYQARTLVTTKGRVLTGLAVEESEQRVVLKIPGGKLETIPREQIAEYQVSDVSMMPEQLE